MVTNSQTTMPGNISKQGGMYIRQKRAIHFLLLLFLLTCPVFSSKAQIINAGSQIENNAGSTITIPDNYIKTDTSARINNAGTIIIGGDLINQNTGEPIFEYKAVDKEDTISYKGRLYFIGDSVQRVTSRFSGKENFHRFIIDKSDNEVQLEADVFIGTKLEMKNKNLYLNSREIEFEYNLSKNAVATIDHESEWSYVYDDSIGTGALYSIVDGSMVDDNPFDDSLGIEVISTAHTNSLKIERRHYRENEVANGSINRVFRLIPMDASDEDNPYDHLVANYYDFDYNPSQLDEENFGPWLNEGNNTRWYTGWKEGTSQRDTDLNFVTGDHNQVYGTGKTVAIAEVDCDNPPPIHFKSDSLYLCGGAEVKIKPDSTEGLEHKWSTGSTSVEITVNTEGWYTLQVWGVDGCTNRDSVFVDVKPIPEAEIGFYGAGFTCFGNEIKFKNLTDRYDDPAAVDPEKLDTIGHQYTWLFHDGSSSGQMSEEFEPIYTYRNQGTFYPELIVESRFECKDTATIDVRILEIPKAKFTAENLCQDDTISIDHQSSTEGSSGTVRYDWGLLPEGLTYTTMAFDDLPEWSLENGGKHEISLITTLNGCSDTTSQQFIVNNKPQIDFAIPASACQGTFVDFKNNSVIDSGFVSYHWEMGNGQTSALEEPTAKYDEAGIFSVKLTATSGEGCAISDSSEIEIISLPDTDFTIANACAEDTIQVDILNFIAGNTYQWKLDGVDYPGANPLRLAFDEAGSHSLELAVSTPQSCAAKASQSMEIYPKPQAGFLAENQCFGGVAVFVDQSTIDYGSMNRLWKFGDDIYSTERNPKVAFESAGEYDVYLKVTSEYGCESTHTDKMEIIEAPYLDIPDQMQTCGTAYELNAGPIDYNYLWSDHSTSNVNTFTASGAYWVQVSNALGCSRRADFEIELNQPISPSLGEDSIFCEVARLDAGYPGSTYQWSDGSTGRYLDVSESGYYSVAITDQNGCEASAGLNVIVNDMPGLDLGEDINICSDEELVLDAGEAGSYLWNDHTTDRYLTVSSSGLYSVKVISEEGCEAEDMVYVDYNGNPALEVPSAIEACDQVTIDAGEGYQSYQWSNGKNTRFITFTSSEKVELTVANNTGCTVTETIQVTVNESPVIDLGDDIDLCYGNTAYLISDYDGKGDYLWSTEERTEEIFVNESGTYSLTITTPAGCSGSDEVGVNIRPSLTVNLPREQKICRGQDGMLQAGDPDIDNSQNTYQWYYQGEMIENANASELQVSNAGWYMVSASNDLGCSSVDSVRVFETTNEINAEFLVNSIANVGDSLKFIQLTSPDPSWYQWHMGNGYKTYDYHPNYVYYVEGEYDVSLVVSNNVCLDTATKTITIKPLRTNENNQEAEFNAEEYFTELLEFNVYPNPTLDKTYVELKINKPSNVYLVMYSLSGIKVDEIRTKGEELKLELNLEHLTNGVYILKGMIDGEIPIYKKLIKM